MEKINQRIRLTKRLLKESFVEMLLHKEINKISIRELCEKAGINHCTFYKYYGSQYDLLKEMEEDMLHIIEQTIAEQINIEPLFVVLKYLEENIKTAKLLVNNNVDPLFPEKLFSLSIVQERLTKNLDIDNNCYFDYITNFVFYGAYRIIQIWLNKDKRETPEEMAKLLLSIVNKRNNL